MITLPVGSGSSSTVTFDVFILDDTLLEGTEDIIVTATVIPSQLGMAAFEGGALTHNTTIFIMDDDTGKQ